MRISLAILAYGMGTYNYAYATVPDPRHWYLPAKQGQWCAYASEAARQKAADINFVYDSASARVVGGQVLSLRYFRSDESGDWSVIDDYSFRNGEVSALTRTFNSLENGRVVDSLVARNGRLVRTSRRHLSIYGNTPIKPKKGVDYDAHMSVYARLDATPFFPVVFDKPKSGALCKPATPDTPAMLPASKPRAATAGRLP